MGTDRFRIIGKWSARAMFVLEMAYVVVFIVGFASLGNTKVFGLICIPLSTAFDSNSHA